MASLTITVPDELAIRLEPLLSRLPELLKQLLATSDATAEHKAESTDFPPVYTEVLDFLIKSPTPQEIAAFQVSPQAQARLRFLLDKNRKATLTGAEVAELDVYEQLETIMILLKARAVAATS